MPRLFAFGLDDLLAAIVTGWRDMVTQVYLASDRLDSQRRIPQKVMRAMHATLGRGLLILLNSHFTNSFFKNSVF